MLGTRANNEGEETGLTIATMRSCVGPGLLSTSVAKRKPRAPRGTRTVNGFVYTNIAKYIQRKREKREQQQEPEAAVLGRSKIAPHGRRDLP